MFHVEDLSVLCESLRALREPVSRNSYQPSLRRTHSLLRPLVGQDRINQHSGPKDKSVVEPVIC